MSMPIDSGAAPWYADGLRFACTGCGACCKGDGYVWVDADEIVRLAARVGLDVEAFGRRYLRRVSNRLSLVDGADQACVFWEDGCTVYEVRPGQCRTFPFWRENVASPEAWAVTGAESPGVNQGRLYSIGEIDRLLSGQGAASDKEPERCSGAEKAQAAHRRREGES